MQSTIKRSTGMKRSVSLLSGIALSVWLLLVASNAWAEPKMCFPRHEGLPFAGSLPPTVDGYIEPELGVLTTEFEQGWTRSGRITYVGDTLKPLMVAQTIKHKSQDFIYLSFDVRDDESFDMDDRIVLVLRPSYSTGGTTPTAHTADVRRIDISPLYLGLGAGPASQPNDTPPVPTGAPSSSEYNIRTNREPRNKEYYRWQPDISTSDPADGQWIVMGAGSVSNVEIKIRSWDLGLKQKHWSVEIKLPTKRLGANGGGTDWIDLDTDYGLYYNVIRVCGITGLCDSGSIPIKTFASNQFTWPRADYSTLDRIIQDPDTGAIPFDQHVIPASWLGHAIIGSSISDCRGVRFVSGSNSIGVQNPANPTGPLISSIHATNNNTFVAQVMNDGTSDADGVRARFRIANWGIGGADATWQPIPRPLGPPSNFGFSSRQSIPTGGATVDLTFDWLLSAIERGNYCNPNVSTCPPGALWSHQCLWVQLDSNSDVDFSDASVRRNMNFVGLSKFRDTAEISAKGYKELPNTDMQEFFLRVNKIRIPSFREIDVKTLDVGYGDATVRRRLSAMAENNVARIPNLSFLDLIAFQRQRNAKDKLSQWVWTMHAHRRTQATLTMSENRYAIYEPVGGFGYFAEHKGQVAELKDVVEVQEDYEKNPDFPDSYRLRLKTGDVTQIKTELEAEEKTGTGRICGKYVSVAAASTLVVGIVFLGLFAAPSRRQ